jgi:hypothetical protein
MSCNPLVLFLKTCQNCEGVEERLFTDSWTGLELCPMCLSPVINGTTMSPASEGDNLKELLKQAGRGSDTAWSAEQCRGFEGYAHRDRGTTAF